jgi:carbon starvation protein CstA
LLGLLILVCGYFLYGKIIEKIFGPDDREVPAKKNFDGLDYMVLPDWKNKLIQLLNIAGVGPVIGVIIGIKFGEIVFLLIPIGCILAGAVHDFTAGMMSLRNEGANLTGLIKLTTNKKVYALFSIFMIIALLLVVAVFITTPAQLLAGLLQWKYALIGSVAGIFVYYVLATLFPVDQIIGRVYPLFGGLLLLGTLLLFGKLMWTSFSDPGILVESAGFKAGKFTSPIIPMLFVTIACGILSGFHATQAPIVARTMSSEHQARGVFFGMMALEGFIAMVWSAGAMAVYNRAPEWMGKNATAVLHKITSDFLGSNLAMVVVISVIILAVTSGDTAMRCLRLSLAEMFKLNQKPIINRLIITVPLIVAVSLLLWWSNVNSKSFQMLWNYFAWSNQALASVVLWTIVVYLYRERSNYWVALIPAIFMTYICSSFVFVSGQFVGMGSAPMAYLYGGLLTLVITAYMVYALKRSQRVELKKR